jgi:hypothetical protein
MLPAGTSVGLEEMALSVIAVATLSRSPTVRLILPERSSVPQVPPAPIVTVGGVVNHGDADRFGGHGRGRRAVAGPVGERVAAGEVRGRGVGERAVGVNVRLRGSARSPAPPSADRRPGRRRTQTPGAATVSTVSSAVLNASPGATGARLVTLLFNSTATLSVSKFRGRQVRLAVAVEVSRRHRGMCATDGEFWPGR